MTTYAELQAKVARALRDEGGSTFGTQAVQDMIASAWAEVSRVAPWRFQEDITPVADTLSYDLLSDYFAEPCEDIEVNRVEIWDSSTTPQSAWKRIPAMSQHPAGLTYSNVGWVVWAGRIELPGRYVDLIDVDKHYYRIWGYSPFPLPATDEDPLPFGNEREQAVILVSQIEGTRRLVNERDLFKQWQTRSNNADVSPASLMNMKNLLDGEWIRRQKAIFVLREVP